MKLKILKESQVSDNEVIAQLKELDSRFAPLKDTTIQEIVAIYKDEADKKGVNIEGLAQEISDWFDDFGGWALFVFDKYKDLPVKTIANIAENDEQLAGAIRKYLKDLGLIDENDFDLAIGADASGHQEHADLLKMCSWIFSHMPERRVPEWAYAIAHEMENLEEKWVEEIKENNPEINELDFKKELIAKKQEFIRNKISEDPEKYRNLELLLKRIDLGQKTYKDVDYVTDSINYLEQAYHDLFEDLDKDICQKCKQKPCVCSEAVEEIEIAAEKIEDNPEEKEEVETEKVEETPAEEAQEQPEQKLVDSAFAGILNNIIQHQWDLVNEIQVAISQFEYDYKGSANINDILEVLKETADEATINVGMMYKAVELLSADTSELLATGVSRAEETID